MNDIIPKDLNELLGAGDYLRLTILQVNKDLSSFTTERLEETEIDPDKIRTQLEQIITLLQEQGFSSLNGFVYRVDLHENKYQDFLKSNDKSFLAQEILKREVLKVYLKSQLSDK
ncbi:MAG: hypothetical protein MK078_11320 [Crocinitomicaceae bacterium]|nr:hypothetical protein [Crocinitomicaceae bacterium]